MRLLRLSLVALAMAAFAAPPALAARAQHWVQVDGRDAEHMAGFVDLKSLKRYRRMVRIDGLIVPRETTSAVDHLRVTLEFDCQGHVYKRLRVTQVDIEGAVLNDQQDTSPVTQATGEDTPPDLEDMVCRSSLHLRKRLALKSESAAVEWARAQLAPYAPGRGRP